MEKINRIIEREKEITDWSVSLQKKSREKSNRFKKLNSKRWYYFKIVIDTSILFSYFSEKSITKKIINLNLFRLYTPIFAFEEIKKYKKEIIQKTKITEKEYLKIISELKKRITIVDEKKYLKQIKNIKEIPDVNDIDFIALSINLDKILWSNYKKLKEQNYTFVLNTEEILEIIFKLKITI